MTDLVTLIKTAIENVPQRDGNGRIDTQAMAEAAAKVAVEETAKVAEVTWEFEYNAAHPDNPEEEWITVHGEHSAAAIRALYRP